MDREESIENIVTITVKAPVSIVKESLTKAQGIIGLDNSMHNFRI